jgi:hypothetical protein
VVRAREKTIDHYVDRLERHLVKQFPHLRFRVKKWSEREATVYYEPYLEEEDVAITHQAGGVLTDALVDAGLRVWLMPDGAA